MIKALKALFHKPTSRNALVQRRIDRKRGNTPRRQADAYETRHKALMRVQDAVRGARGV